VIAERPFPAALARLDVALEHDVRARGHFEGDSHALDELDPLPRQKSAEQELVETELLVEEISIDGMCGVY